MHLSSMVITVNPHREIMAFIKSECVKTESMRLRLFVCANVSDAGANNTSWLSISILWLDSHGASIKSQHKPKWKRSTVTRLSEV